MVAAILMGLTGVNASPLDKRDINPQYSTLATCIRRSIPEYPHGGGKPTTSQVNGCLAEAKSSASTKRSLGTSLPSQETRNDLSARNIIESVIKAGQTLSIDQKPFCDGEKVHDNFLWVTDIRESAVDICQELNKQISETGIAQDGGVGLVVKQFTSGHDKQANQLKDYRKVTATFLLNLIPPAKATLDTVKQISSGLDELCHNAIEKIATKNMGCTAEIKYYRPSKAKSFTGTGAIGGFLEVVYGAAKDAVANISVDFSNDN